MYYRNSIPPNANRLINGLIVGREDHQPALQSKTQRKQSTSQGDRATRVAIQFDLQRAGMIVRRMAMNAWLTLAVTLAFGAPAAIRADDFSWNAGDGLWHDANNWTPNGVPGADPDVIRIGDLPGIQNSVVTLGAPSALYQSLAISNGMTLDMAGGQLISGGPLTISGVNSRLLVRPTAGPNFHDLNGALNLGVGAHLELIDNAKARLFSSQSQGVISGRGLLQLNGTFNNNGLIRPGINGGMQILVGQPSPDGLIDLDGSNETGGIQLQQQFSQLEIIAGGLTDAFSSTITMAPGSLLTMNIDDGWSVDANGSINVAGFGNANNVSQINGSHFTFGGTMTVGGNLGRLRVLSDVTYAPAASVNVNFTDGLEMTGSTNVQSAQFTMDEGALLTFAGPTNVQGGSFTTHSNDIADGFVAFDGPTNWSGNATINGVARQNGTATVNAPLSSVINADILDMDGAVNNTTWNINTGLVINAERISTSLDNSFHGTMNIGSGFMGRLTMNLGGGVPSRWIMAGEMNLSGNAFAAFPIDRVAGSAIRVTGDVNVNHQVRVTADAEFMGGSSLNFNSATSRIQFTGGTLIHGGAGITGNGTLENGVGGSMVLGDGLMLGAAGLSNRGLLQIGDSPGVISVDRFENLAAGTWLVELGGLLAGTEHDLMIVGGGLTSLDGFLEVDLIDLGLGGGVFIPEIGDTFTILASLGGVNGMFLNSPITTLGPQQFHWDVIYNPHDVQLQLTAISVPEPSSLLLISGIGLGFLIRRRRRNQTGQMAVTSRSAGDSHSDILHSVDLDALRGCGCWPGGLSSKLL